MAKTIKFTDLIERTNTFMKESADSAHMERIAVHSFVSDLLMKAGNYSGFGYLTPYESPDCDSSRTFFYVHRKLKT